MSTEGEIVPGDVNPEPAQVETQAEPSQEFPQEQAEPAEPKLVPLAALHEERTRRKDLQAEVARERMAREETERRVQARLDALTAALAPKQQAPSFDENPAGYLQHSLEEVKGAAMQTKQEIEAWRAQQHQQQQIELAASRVRAAEQSFIATRPDYQKALDYYTESRIRELAAFGLDTDQARAQVGQEMLSGALQHAAQGRNPAELAYKLAEARGYRPQATTADKIQAQQRGVAAAKTLGSGGATGGAISARALLEMSDDDFAEATKGGKWEKLMGGR